MFSLVGDDLGEPCDDNDETDLCTIKNNRTVCVSDGDGNPVCSCSEPFLEENGICECSCDDGCPCGNGQECINGECVPECVGCEVRMPGGECVELLYGDNCTLFPNDCCRDDLACINGTCECVNAGLQNDEDEDKCLGDDLGEPCDDNDETDLCTIKNNRTVCVSDGDGNPVCSCSEQFFVENGICECSCDDGDSCPCGNGQECINGECVPECVGCEVRMPGGECVELGHGDDCTLFPDGCCRDDLACMSDKCECVNAGLQNDEDEDKCLGDDLGEPCDDDDDEPDLCTIKNSLTECVSDGDGNPVCSCSQQYTLKDGICECLCSSGGICACDEGLECVQDNCVPECGRCEERVSGVCSPQCNDSQVCNENEQCVTPLALGDECTGTGSANACMRDDGIKCRSGDCCGNANGNPDYPCNVKYCVCETEWGYKLNASQTGCELTGNPVVPKGNCEDMLYV
ncbi:neurogenic locus notch homolog protein 1-like [Mya arenaria]|uniref:neurogenic locus notch homolog protein 1-like n=1 Tax=Mya arenaria TaxID=6604 RepID=UPI0022E84475|nr:neurogenic locus notch homolog protein 1-like [Mya arenaria]